MEWSAVRTWFHGVLRPLGMSSSGASLLWAIAAITAVGGFAAAITSLSPSAMQEKLAGERASAAYYAAMSGLNYSKAMAEEARAGGLGNSWAMSSLAGTYSLGNNTITVLSVSGGNGLYTVTSRGVVQAGSANEANYTSKATILLPNLRDLNFNNPSGKDDYARNADDQTRDFPAGLDNHDITTKNFVVGKDYHYGFGNIWYAGTRPGKSTDGKSSFATGFRLFFTFTFTTNIGDGFVVSILNGTNNNYLSCGGDSAEGGLLGYAGDSRVYASSTGEWSNTIAEYVDQSGFTKGLNPPKFGVEIDTYVNSGGTWSPNDTTAACTGDNGLMNDLSVSSGGGHHVGVDFWGTDTTYLRKTCYGPGSVFNGNLKRYSDVRHGSGDNASNDSSGNSALKYFTFSKNVSYYYRMDVIPDGSNYTIKSWVAKCNDTDAQCSQQVYGTNIASHAGSLSDTKTDFAGKNSALNRLRYVYVTENLILTAAQKTQFSKFIWGFTSGSGAATQQIEFRNLGLSLR